MIVALREKKDFVRKIYAAKKSSKSGYDVYYFGFCFQKKAPYQVRFEILEIAERYLKISGFFQSDALFNVFEGGDSEKLKKLKKDVFSCKIYDADDEYLPSAVD